MQNKNFCVALLMLFVITLTACGTGGYNLGKLEINKDKTGNIQETQPPVTEKSQSSDNNMINNTKNEDNSNSSIEKVYETKKESYIYKNIKIDYPQIINFNDVNKQKLINELIRNDILKVLNNYKDNKDHVSLMIDYNVMLKNSKLLSIEYIGQESFEDYPRVNNLFYSTNINISNVSKIRLKDIINIDDKFVSKFMSEKFKALISELSPIKELKTTEEWMNLFNTSDLIENVGTENQSETYSYLTEDSLGISVGVGHNAGDHAEFEIKYQDLKDNIKTENEIWKDLLH
ncbi:polysaccharide deacetylase family protein [Anaeromicropila herbilytica]|uniref:Deacetylase PdaC domain-containing protein n=1 Tax=Anaeromicropila herbilytica TaxID=2785025 RepID=A0A7R7EJ83_9FIRM|nr:hypothetical protein [Anaeromicropila herbilytica]BCN29432.1 hypothetical protein bsdtb5_07270 [Anaeromicropila herbilytica]